MNRRKFFSLFTAAIAAVPFLRRFKPWKGLSHGGHVTPLPSDKLTQSYLDKHLGWGWDRHATHKLVRIDGVDHYYELMPDGEVRQELYKDTDGYLKPKV